MRKTFSSLASQISIGMRAPLYDGSPFISSSGIISGGIALSISASNWAKNSAGVAGLLMLAFYTGCTAEGGHKFAAEFVQARADWLVHDRVIPSVRAGLDEAERLTAGGAKRHAAAELQAPTPTETSNIWRRFVRTLPNPLPRWLVFTQPGCVPCDRLYGTMRPALTAVGWTWGTDCDADFQLIDAAEFPEIAEQYGVTQTPAAVLVDATGKMLERAGKLLHKDTLGGELSRYLNLYRTGDKAAFELPASSPPTAVCPCGCGKNGCECGKDACQTSAPTLRVRRRR